MIKASKHIIEKIHLEFNTANESKGKQLERQSIELFQQKLLPKMEKVFDRFGEDQNIRLENLSIEIDANDPIKFEEQFINQFLEQLSRKLEEAQIDTPESSEKESNLFAYFLENGHFPWWAKESSVAELEKKILEKNQIPSIVTILGNDPEKLKRLVFQFSDEVLQALVENQNLIDFIQDLQHILSKFYTSAEVRNQLWLFGFEAIFFKTQPAEETKIYIFKSAIDHFSKSKNSIIKREQLVGKTLTELKSVEKKLLLKLEAAVQGLNLNIEKSFQETRNKSERQIDEKPGQKEWYVNNAGLVLLHPFFVLFFEGLGLTKENVFVNQNSKNQAALLLQYLVTGEVQSFENELILNKIFCDIPLFMPIEKDLILDDKIKGEAEQLLNAVIKHWSALKNTSLNGLRNTFLQREGKLTKNENGSWKLFIQHTSFDLLISKLPWSISIIKLPWMKNMFQVEWA